MSFFIGSGSVRSGSVSLASVLSGSIDVSSVISGNIAPGAVTSGALASGSIGNVQVASGGLVSGSIASGSIGNVQVASGGLTSGAIASGSIGAPQIASGGLVSGSIASGNIITYSRGVVMDTFTTDETISGVRCVQIQGSGLLRIAMAAVSGRMPADGVAFTNALAGSPLMFVREGFVLGPSAEIGSGLCISGRTTARVWVGASGELVTISGGGPTIGIGDSNSGALGQLMGHVGASGSVVIHVGDGLLSGEAIVTTDTRFWPL